MARRKKIRTRVTKEQIDKARKPKKLPKINKKGTNPGPWTNMHPKIEVDAVLFANSGVMGEYYGTYPKHSPVSCERGWYTILFNLTSKNIKEDIEKHGIDCYISACEKSPNSAENKKKYGTVVILKVTTDNHLNESEDRRFLSCYAKTNKKSIKGFTAIRKDVYRIL